MTNEQAYVVLENCASLLDSGTRFFTEDHTKQFREAYELAMKALRKTERKTGKWIPCSERLPKENAGYLVQLSYGIRDVLRWANILEKVDDYDFHNKKHGGWYEYDSEWGYYEIHEVVAWMPLPEPYKRGDTHD